MPSTSKSINAHLLSLLPSYAASTLPPALVDMTASLSATSRARAAHLKAEEELAREYVCAVMAIDRLKGRLNLPEAEVKPPIPPRAFAKLLATFNRLIPASNAKLTAVVTKRYPPSDGTSTSATGGGLGSPQVAGQKRKADGQTPMPRPESRPASLPIWLKEYLRDLSRALDAPQGFENAMTTGILASCPDIPPAPVAATALAASPSKKPLGTQEKISKTLVALTLIILPKLGQDIQRRETTRTAVKELILKRMVTMTQFGRVVAESEALLEEKGSLWRATDWWQALKPVEPRIVRETHEQAMQSRTPIQMAQHSAVQSDPGLTAPNDDPMEVGEDSDDAEQAVIPRELPRCVPGSMIQARVDWLSPERRRDYAVWEADIMHRIEEMEHS